MELSEKDRMTLLANLVAKGWIWENDFIYAPHKTIWFFGMNPWQSDLADFHDRMAARVERLARNKHLHSDPQQHQNALEDTQNLVDVLEGMMSKQFTVMSDGNRTNDK
jgi:hypothetical protein